MTGIGGILDEEQIERGIRRIEWAREHMHVLGKVSEMIRSRGFLKGKRIAMALHVEAKTACLALSLMDAGAAVRLASCNPLSTDDSVSAALNAHYGLETFARKGEGEEEYYSYLNSVLDIRPDLVIDDGADLITLLHTDRKEMLGNVKGGNEETTTGVLRMKAMEREGLLRFPVIAVNSSHMKFMFDNRYGTGQSTLDGLMNATNLVLAGSRVVVAGYGWCGKGIAQRARGMGAIVTVTEIDPIRAVEALMDGFNVGRMAEEISRADFVITATGCRDVVTYSTCLRAKDGCVLANAGHFNLEIDADALRRKAKVRRVREYVEEFVLPGGKKIYLIGDGRLVNLVAGQGHPAEIMDLSFSLQALAADYLASHPELRAGVHVLPESIDIDVARMKLEAMGVHLDRLSNAQKKYLDSWNVGT